MRITIEKGFQPLIRDVMQKIGVDDPRLALNHILGTYAASKNNSSQSPPSLSVTQSTDAEDEFSELTDWS